MFPRSRASILLGGADPTLRYRKRILATAQANLIAYWPMDESVGATVATDRSAQANNGAYANVTLGQTGIGDGRTAAWFNNSSSLVNVYSAALNADFNGQELTVACWFKMNAAGVWTDGAFHEVFRFQVSADSFIQLFKSNTNNTLQWTYKAATVNKNSSTAALGGNVGWIHMAFVVSLAGGYGYMYLNATKRGTDLSGLGTWAGALLNTACCFGAGTTAAANPWSGWIAHAAVWTTPLSPAQVTALATV